MKQEIIKIIEDHFQTTLPTDAEYCANEILKAISQKGEKKHKSNKLIIQCDCSGSEFVTFIKFEDDGDPDYHEIYVAFHGTEIYGLWRRLKMAWKIIRWGEFQNDGVLIWEERNKLIEWLQNLE